MKHIEDATTWLRKSHEAVGQCGFSIGFDLRRGWLAPYAETTGYIIPTLLRLVRYGAVPDVQDMALRSGEWLLKIQHADGSFPDYRGRARNYRERPPVVFNTAQDIFGVTACHAWTGEERFLNSAVRAAEWLVRQMNPQGVWDTPGFGAGPSRSYYSRVTWPMAVVGHVTQDARILEAARKGASRIARMARDDGWIDEWDFNPNESAFTHTMAYTIEGLLEQAAVTDCAELEEVGVRALTAVARAYTEKQSLAGSYVSDWSGDHSYMCGPGNCQFAILFMRFSDLTNRQQEWMTIGNRLLDAALSAKLKMGILPAGLRGAVPASSPMILGHYEQFLVPNWGQKYAIDAVLIRDAFETGRVPSLFETLRGLPG